MKKLVRIFLVLALAAPAGALAADATSAATNGKDLCLLTVAACPDRVDSITEKIAKLQHEIGKGTAVYTPQELRILERELRSYLEYYDNLVYSGGA